VFEHLFEAFLVLVMLRITTSRPFSSLLPPIGSHFATTGDRNRA